VEIDKSRRGEGMCGERSHACLTPVVGGAEERR